MDFVTVLLKEASFLSASGFSASPAKQRAFLAYRMQVQTSVELHHDLRRELRTKGVELLAGRVEPGADWAPTVRRRIASSKVFAADLTGPSKEVLFELGFSGNKPLYPLVESSEDRLTLPRWITSKQFELFGQGRVTNVADSLARYVANPNKYVVSKRSPPVPGVLAWVTRRGLTWASGAREQVRNLCQEKGIAFREHYDEDFESPEDLADALRASIIVGLVDGGSQDYSVHFLMGDIAGRRTAGAGRGKGQAVQRRGFVLVKTAPDVSELVADSLRRVPQSMVRCTHPEQVRADVRSAVDSYVALMAPREDDEI